MKLLNVLSVGLLVLFVTTSSACVDDSTDEATTASSPSLWSMLVDTPVDAVAEKLHPQPTRRLRKRKEANQPEDRELAEEGKEALASEDRLHFLGRLLMQSGNAGNAGGFGLGHGGGIFNGQGRKLIRARFLFGLAPVAVLTLCFNPWMQPLESHETVAASEAAKRRIAQASEVARRRIEQVSAETECRTRLVKEARGVVDGPTTVDLDRRADLSEN